MSGDPDLARLLKTVYGEVEPSIGEGKVADYIPALAAVDPRQFAMAIFTRDGRSAAVGAADSPFSIQSVSKVFTLSMALTLLGEGLWARVGREPSGSPFNSIVQLEFEEGIPRNPLINAGGLVVTDTLVEAHGPGKAIREITGLLKRLAGDARVHIDETVADSEIRTAYRNAALVNFMRAFCRINSDIEEVLNVYARHCAVTMSCRQLARAGLYLANSGKDPFTETMIVSKEHTKRINAIMLTCGHYDASGDFAFKVGLPGKSGVSGGILAIAPHKASIAVWSPGLSAQGNSLAGTRALEALSRLTGWSVF